MATTRYYKAVRPDGTSFYDPNFWWVPENWTPADGPVEVYHPDPPAVGAKATVKNCLSVATVPTECDGMLFPCHLLVVEPIGTVHQTYWPHQRLSPAWRVVDKLPAHEAFGPQGEQVVALIERAKGVIIDEVGAFTAKIIAWDEARSLACDTARRAAWWASGRAAWYASCGAARDAVWALMVRDLISVEHYDVLTLPWRQAVGRIHPDDPEV